MGRSGVGESKTVLHDRRIECAAIDRLVGTARTGQSGVLVARGEAGAGKSALLGYASEAASGFRVARACGVESEMELAFAGLQQLCAPLLDGLERLPPPQRDAIETAFALSRGSPPDRFFMGLAVLSLLADAARERPLLCVIDDAQWLDGVSTQALAFVARRLQAESVLLVFATRNTLERDELSGLPELTVEGLPDADARMLLAATIPGLLDERVTDRIVAETRGNPLALLELPRGLALVELAGGFGFPDTLPLAGQIEESFRRRVERLPSQTQQLLLLAVAEPTGDAALLWRASAFLGIGVGASACGGAVREGELCRVVEATRHKVAVVYEARLYGVCQRHTEHQIAPAAARVVGRCQRHAKVVRRMAGLGRGREVVHEIDVSH
jgi:hypothetical protein